jgi:CubicO group peptidase (beta-lactamase class C family)
MIIYKYILLSFIAINILPAQNLDLSQPWSSSDDFIFLNQLENVISENIEILPNIAGILISKNGKIIFERYYNGSNVDEIYPIWSITKSFLSTIVGQAYDLQLISDPELPLSNFLDYDIEYLDTINLKHLLTMKSGYIPIDNYIYATTYDLANAEYWEGSDFFYYQNSACHLISHVIFHNTNLTPYYFANIHLFPKLGIINPYWEFGWNYINDGGKGLWLNLRDMSKLGQLYLQNGFSGDSQILSSSWIERATVSSVQTGLDPLQGYGYLFWIPDVDSTYFENSFFMMGTGGQNIFVSPRHNLLIATHSHLYPENINEHSDTLFLNIWNNLIPIFKLGDLNTDTKIDIFDIIKLSDLITSLNNYNEESDINSDNTINEEDLIILIFSILNN